MAVSVTDSVKSIVSLSWLTGPILEKELRVSSRRRRNYFLRTAYLLFLTIFVAYVWFFTVNMNSRGGSPTYRISRMSVAAATITTTIAWFQFIALQLTALVMLSNSINDEVRKKTLDVLIATPITSLQIVMGKLTSKLLQLMILLGVSLPLLAVVRAFGGVPWDYLIASLCVTLTAAVFAASVSLFLSTMKKNAYMAITSSIAMALVLYAGLPAFASLMFFLTKNPLFQKALPFTLIINPFAAMSFLTSSMFSPTTAGSLAGYSWPVHCCIMIGLSSFLLLIAVFRIRPVVLNRDKKPLAYRFGRKCKNLARKKTSSRPTASNGSPIRRIKGDPIIWRELNRPMTGAMFSGKAGVIILVTLLIVTYILAVFFKVINNKAFHSAFVGIITLVILMRTAALAATAISTEKQTKAWPILLTTPYEDAQIIRSKGLAVLRRTLPFWIMLLIHVIFFTLTGVLYPLALVLAFISVAPAVLFLIGSGLLAGTIFKTTTGATVATFAIPVAGWFFCPCLVYSNPAFMVGWSMQIDPSMFSDLASEIGSYSAFGFVLVVLPIILYTAFGFLFLFLAKQKVRRNVFG